IAVWMAALHTAAAARGQPLWHLVAEGGQVTLPMPMIQIFGGGAHAGRRVDIQDFLIVPVGAESFDEALAMAARVYRAAGEIMAARGRLRGVADEGGWWPEFASNVEALDTLVETIERAGFVPDDDVGIAVDIAASQFRCGDLYRLAADGVELDTRELVELLTGWCRRYPIVSIEDPVAEDDDAGMISFTAGIGGQVQII